MKTKISLILLFIFTINNYAQKGIITYTTNSIISKKPTTDRTKKTLEEINRSVYTLTYNSKESYFKKKKILHLHEKEQIFASILTNTNYDSFQFNNTNKNSYANSEILDSIYIVDYTKAKMKDWELLNEKKIIDGFVCFKAVKKVFNPRSGNNIVYEAWYTTNIPLPFGPAGYGGLPGIILELKLGKRVIFAVKKIVLNPKTIKKNKPLKTGEIISIKKMVALKRNARGHRN